MSPRKLLLVVGINAGVVIVLMTLLELAASLFVSLPRAHLLTSWRINHHYKPGASRVEEVWVADNPDFAVPYTHRYNAQGWLEDYDVEREKPEGVYRIFYLGDSFTAGTVRMDGSVPSLVESKLNLRAPAGARIEVINAATESYSPLIHYVLVRYVLLDYQPDLIVMDVDMTDDLDDWKYQQTVVLDEEGNPEAVPPRDIERSTFVDTGDGLVRQNWATRLHLMLYTRSHLYNGIADRLAPDPADDPERAAGTDPSLYRRWAWCQFHWDEATETQVERTLDWIGRTVELAQERGVKIMLTGVPHYQQYNGLPGWPLWSRRPHDEIERVARERGAAYLDSHEALRADIVGTEQSDYYYHRDMHFNPRGYALWADAHVEFLQDPANGLIPDGFLAGREE